MVINILLISRWFNSLQSLHKVVHTHVGTAKQRRWVDLHQSHGFSVRIRWVRGCPATILSLAEVLAGLALTDGHHEGFVDDDGDVGAGVAF